MKTHLDCSSVVTGLTVLPSIPQCTTTTTTTTITTTTTTTAAATQSPLYYHHRRSKSELLKDLSDPLNRASAPNILRLF
jgi:hypothetical protein